MADRRGARLNIAMTEGLYTCNTPSFDQVECCRTVRGMSVLPPHEALDKELFADPGQWARLEYACKSVGTKLPRARSGSQLGCGHGASSGTVHRWRAVYQTRRDDWIPYREHGERRQARRCSAEEVGELPVWVQRVVHVVASITGCRVVRPASRRHVVASGRQRAGTTRWSTLGFEGSCVPSARRLVRVCFPTWASQTDPCFVCCCAIRDWRTLDGINKLEWSWSKKTTDMYLAACTANECRVIVNTPYRPCPDRTQGKSLHVDLPALGLLKRDRLEPSHEVPDIGPIESVDTPFVATFWRRSMETMARHRNPITAPG